MKSLGRHWECSWESFIYCFCAARRLGARAGFHVNKSGLDAVCLWVCACRGERTGADGNGPCLLETPRSALPLHDSRLQAFRTFSPSHPTTAVLPALPPHSHSCRRVPLQLEALRNKLADVCNGVFDRFLPEAPSCCPVHLKEAFDVDHVITLRPNPVDKKIRPADLCVEAKLAKICACSPIMCPVQTTCKVQKPNSQVSSWKQT